jgi:capsule polysaccharide export protein KpsE/RkpR
MDNPAALREKVQKSIVDIITARLEDGTMTEERAKEIAQHVLGQLPENITSKELIAILPKMDDNFPEIAPAIVPVMQVYEKQVKATMNEQISKLLQAGKTEEALKLTQQAIEYETKLA